MRELLSDMPELVSAKYLVDIGLYSSNNAAYIARLRGDSPDFIKLKRRVLYKRESVIEFLSARSRSGSDTNRSNSSLHVTN